MLILDGMPGSGKSTRLGHALTHHPEQVLVFPEARPPDHAPEHATMRHLLDEDHARTTAATRLAEHTPHQVAASDRCHLAVLAYRYALARRTGSWAGFEHALTRSRALQLDAAHHHDTVLILHLTADASRQRRGRTAARPQHRCWFDPEFLAAYAEFFSHLHRWVTPGPQWTHRHADDPAIDTTIAAQLPTPATPPQSSNRNLATHESATRDVATRDLPCGGDCGSPRSPTLTTDHGATQLWSGALHRQHPNKPVRCLRSATDITADHGATQR